jgi:hypothetical protein
MPSNSNTKNKNRAYAAEHGISYTAAMRERGADETRCQIYGPDTERIIATAMIGGPLYLTELTKDVYLTGGDALRSIRQDLRALGTVGGSLPDSEEKQMAVAYYAAVKALFELSSLTALRVTPYGAEEKADGFRTDSGRLNIRHHFKVPFAPGGFLDVRMDIEGEDGQTESGVNCWNNYFNEDRVGRAADEPNFDQRNNTCSNALRDYLMDVQLSHANRVTTAKAKWELTGGTDDDRTIAEQNSIDHDTARDLDRDPELTPETLDAIARKPLTKGSTDAAWFARDWVADHPLASASTLAWLGEQNSNIWTTGKVLRNPSTPAATLLRFLSVSADKRRDISYNTGAGDEVIRALVDNHYTDRKAVRTSLYNPSISDATFEYVAALQPKSWKSEIRWAREGRAREAAKAS